MKYPSEVKEVLNDKVFRVTLLKISYNITKIIVDAEDAVQNTYLQFLLYLDRWKDLSNVQRLLIWLVRRESINIRIRTRRKLLPDKFLEDGELLYDDYSDYNHGEYIGLEDKIIQKYKDYNGFKTRNHVNEILLQLEDNNIPKSVAFLAYGTREIKSASGRKYYHFTKGTSPEFLSRLKQIQSRYSKEITI